MAMYRLKLHYSFINKDGRMTKDRIIDSEDPMFDRQRWKFEENPVGHEEEEEATKFDVASLKTKDREGLLEVWAELGGDEPAEDVTVSELRKAIEEHVATDDA